MEMKTAFLTDSQLRALISLMDDDDPGAREHVAGRLKKVLLVEPERIESLIPKLDLSSCRKVRDLLEDVRWDRLEKRFQTVARLPDSRFDLEESVFLLATFAYPHLQREEMSRPLDQMAADLEKMLSGKERPIEALLLINDFLFDRRR